MQLIMIRSLLAVQQTMISDKHCFELYGEFLLAHACVCVYVLLFVTCLFPHLAPAYLSIPALLFFFS